MTDLKPPGFWRWFERAATIVVYSTLAGMAPGAIAGTIVPIFGTVVGAVVGAAVGFVCGAVVTPLIIRRHINRSFLLMLRVSMIGAGAWVLIGWGLAFAGWYSGAVGAVFTYGGLPAIVLSYIGSAWWANSRHPVVWPGRRFGVCARCGYSLAGLPNWICPECGTDNEPKRVAQPE